VVLNLTPVPREEYRIGVPHAGRYVCRLGSDDPRYGGSGYPIQGELMSEDFGMHGFPQSLRLTLPPLAALVFEPA
jgi:1,4-alpha-glucan branching enzyme